MKINLYALIVCVVCSSCAEFMPQQNTVAQQSNNTTNVDQTTSVTQKQIKQNKTKQSGTTKAKDDAVVNSTVKKIDVSVSNQDVKKPVVVPDMVSTMKQEMDTSKKKQDEMQLRREEKRQARLNSEKSMTPEAFHQGNYAGLDSVINDFEKNIEKQKAIRDYMKSEGQDTKNIDVGIAQMQQQVKQLKAQKALINKQ